MLIAPISSTGAPGELGTRPRARSRRSTQRLVEWSDVFSAEASCCAAVPVGWCERGRGERAHAAHLVHAHAANLLKLLCDRRCLGRGASRLKAVEDAVVLARHSSCVPARSHPRGRRHDDHGFQNQNEGEGENGTNPCDEVSEAAAANVLLPMFGIPELIMCCTEFLKAVAENRSRQQKNTYLGSSRRVGRMEEKREEVGEAWEGGGKRYRVHKVVGNGAFGIVWRAVEEGVKSETVAIKKVILDRRYHNRELEMMKGMDTTV